MQVDTEQLVATVDIAAMLGVVQGAVTNWQTRDRLGFPEPVVVVANGNTKLWLRDDVLKWYSSRYGGDLEEQIDRHRAILAALERSRG